MEPRGLVVSLKQTAFFPSGDRRHRPGHLSASSKSSPTRLNAVSNPLRIEGHTDSVPIHTARFRSNWELSAARSIAMMEVFANRFEVDRSDGDRRLRRHRAGNVQRHARRPRQEPPRGYRDSE